MNRHLTKNAIKDFLSLEDDTKKNFPVNHNVQVISIKRNEQSKSSNQQVFTATLSDGDNKYTGFIIFKDPASPEIEEGDIINISMIKQATLNSVKNKVFICSKHEILVKKVNLIGNPEYIKEDSTSKSKSNLPSSGPQSHVTNQPNNQINNQFNNIQPNNRNSNSTSNMNNSAYQDQSITSHERRRNAENPGMPLHSLTTFSKDILIHVRVLKKCEIKEFTTKNSGRLFSFNVLDMDGFEMPITCFNKAVEKFHPVIQEKKCYEIRGGYIKPNEKKFSTVKSDYKLILDENAIIKEIPDDDQININSFNFVRISDIHSLQTGSIVDVMVYVLDVGEKIIKSTKFGEQGMKKATVVDNSEIKIELTLWKHHADLPINKQTVICVKSAKIGDFNGRSLSTLDESDIILDNQFREATELKMMVESYQGEWKTFNGVSGGSNGSDRDNISNVDMIKDMVQTVESIVSDDKIPVVKLKVTVCNFNNSEKNFYAGCPDKNCKKKLIQETYNWICGGCSKSTPKPTYYYTLNLRVKDASGEFYIDIFGDLGAKLLKIPAEEYKDLFLTNDTLKLNQICSNVEYKSFIIIGKPKINYYNGQKKLKFSTYKIEQSDQKCEISRLTKLMGQLLCIR